MRTISPLLSCDIPLPLDLDRHTSFDDKEDFLGARVHVPRGRGTQRHAQHVDHGFLNFLILVPQISAQDLREFRPALRTLG